METISVRTHSRTEFVDITDRIRRVVAASGVDEGICLVHVPHTTAGVTVNENADPAVVRDILKELNKIVPFEDDYAHAEGNSAAHLKSSMMGCSCAFPISGGAPALGTWQAVYFCEFDCPRSRSVWVVCR